jgi:hypothetical protein
MARAAVACAKDHDQQSAAEFDVLSRSHGQSKSLHRADSFAQLAGRPVDGQPIGRQRGSFAFSTAREAEKKPPAGDHRRAQPTVCSPSVKRTTGLEPATFGLGSRRSTN